MMNTTMFLKIARTYKDKGRTLLQHAASSPRLTSLYVLVAPGILLATVLYWSVLGAKEQLANADTLVDPYLFKDMATFHGADFPGQHTQLLKWPLFLLVRLASFSSVSFITITVLMVVLMIAALMVIIYRIERRPLVRSTIYLAITSILLLVPARPYATGLLPVNMAMLTTRNIEYIFYLVPLFLLARTQHVKNWSFWLATVCLTLLIASDKLFLTLGLGASLVALIVYALVRRWELVTMAVYWLIAQVFATLGALNMLFLINSSHFTHITDSSGASPYGVVTNLHELIIGSAYALLGLLTNLGANPASGALILKDVPRAVLAGLLHVGGLAFVVNLLLAAGCTYAVVRLVRRSLAGDKKGAGSTTVAAKVSLMLIWTSVVAIGVFVASNHDYAVDARYLAIILFTFVVAGVTVSRDRNWSSGRLVATGLVLLIAIAAGLLTATRTDSDAQAALAIIDRRDTKIAAVIKLHPTHVLVGDYWRVLPIRQQVGSDLHAMPLATCTTPRMDLSSSAWRFDLSRSSFTYLLSYDQKLTDYPSCSLAQVIQAYGRPNASVLIAGTADRPQEQLLFYDRGAHMSAPLAAQPAKAPSTVLPIALDELPYTSCSTPSVMTIVAHQDDDLLFMNPDIFHALKASYCIRTVYLTAGDGGFGDYYWLKRQLGAEAAYANMLGTNAVWVERIVKLADNEYVTVANPKGNNQISLIFFHLPDGNLQGQGFSYSHHESLAKLLSRRIAAIHSVDRQSTYTADQLATALYSLMNVYSPTEIYTQSAYVSHLYPDHSDHIAVGQLAHLAYAQYEKKQYDNLVSIPISFYIGYPIHGMAENISGDDLQSKAAAFFSYAQYDGAVCGSMQLCKKVPTYLAYLSRQYVNPF